MNIKDIDLIVKELPQVGIPKQDVQSISSQEDATNNSSSSRIEISYTDPEPSSWDIAPVLLEYNEPSVIQNKEFYYSISDTNIIIIVTNMLPQYSWYNFQYGYYDKNGDITITNYQTSGGITGLPATAFVDSTILGGSLKYGYRSTTIGEWDKYASRPYGDWYGIGTFNFNNSLYSTIITPVDPTPVDPNKPKGGGGTRDNDSDEITLPELPTITPINNNMIHCYQFDNAKLSTLGSYLWSTNFIENFSKVFDNPIDAIIGLYQMKYPLNVGESLPVRIGNCESPVAAPIVTNNYSLVDCGSITLNEYFGNALDYSPYTKVSIYLPYVGVRNLDIDYVMGSTINVKYYIECITGTGVCFVYVARDKNGTVLSAPLYSYPCSCNVQIPITSYNMTALYGSIVSGISSVVGGAMSGGVGGAIVGGTIGGANAVLSAKNQVEKSGSITGASGLLGIQKPFLIIERPIDAYAKNYQAYYGLPANMEFALSKMTGFTKVSKINVSSVSKATSTEKDEIERLLKEGVIF